MFVTNHVLSGVVIGRVLERHPVAAFVVGVGSHLALDMIPHWGCDLKQEPNKELFLRYAKRDGLLGLVTAVSAAGAVGRQARPATLAAVTGAVLLDLDKPFLHFWGRNPFPEWVQRIHGGIQNESPEGLPNEMTFGVLCAVADLAIIGRARRRRARTIPAPRLDAAPVVFV